MTANDFAARTVDPFMMALVLVVAVLLAIGGLLMWDRARLKRRRDIERGFNVISDRVSQRLKFRAPRRSDAAFYLEMASDPVASAANGWNGHEAASVKARFGDRKLFAQLRDSELVAVERTSQAPVGTATFSRSPLTDDGARAIGIHVHTDHRNQGYGRELMAGAIALMKYEPGPIHVGTLTTNVGMQRIMQQLGYEPEPNTHPYAAPDGRVYESYWYRVVGGTAPTD